MLKSSYRPSLGLDHLSASILYPLGQSLTVSLGTQQTTISSSLSFMFTNPRLLQKIFPLFNGLVKTIKKEKVNKRVKMSSYWVFSY